MTTIDAQALDHRRDRRHRPPREAARGRPLHRRARATTSTTSCCPGMLHMAILRSPVAARRASSASTRRPPTALDGVVAVVTGELLAQYGLAWMPTMSGDTQAVLATDKVRFQGQEVAAVVATDPYIAEDALELIDVDYDLLPADHDRRSRRWRTDAVADPRRQGGPDRQPRLRVGGRRRGRDRRGVRGGRPGRHARDALPALAPGAARDVRLSSPTSTPATGQATIYMTSQAPHAHPHACSRWSPGLPEQNIRIISPDIGGGFGNKVPMYPGYVVATAASLVIGTAGEVDRDAAART